MFEAIEGIRSIRLARIEKPEITRTVRHEWDDGHKRQGWMESTQVQRSPRQRPWTDHIRPEAQRSAPSQPPCDENGGRHEYDERPNRQGARRVEQSEDDQSQRIVGNRE